jgi:hypothetical protein
VALCRRTPDGSAYPLDMPWGNSGTIMSGICASALYNYWNFDDKASPVRLASRCFMRKQLGYHYNHKCSHTGACNTGTDEGFSYTVGCASWPCA